MTVSAGTYTLTRDQLADLLDEAIVAYVESCRMQKAYDGKPRAQRYRAGIRARIIAETLAVLDFDATRPISHENGASGASAEGEPPLDCRGGSEGTTRR